MADAAARGMIPSLPSTRARAASKLSIACRTESSEKSSASGPVVDRDSIKRTGMPSLPSAAIELKQLRIREDRLTHQRTLTQQKQVALFPHRPRRPMHVPVFFLRNLDRK